MLKDTSISGLKLDKVIVTQRIVTLGWSAERWELFTDLTGADSVARELNETFTRAVNAGLPLADVALEMYAIMRLRDQFGADDSEVHYNLGKLLDEVFK